MINNILFGLAFDRDKIIEEYKNKQAKIMEHFEKLCLVNSNNYSRHGWKKELCAWINYLIKKKLSNTKQSVDSRFIDNHFKVYYIDQKDLEDSFDSFIDINEIDEEPFELVEDFSGEDCYNKWLKLVELTKEKCKTKTKITISDLDFL